jgi:hypothetical protein
LLKNSNINTILLAGDTILKLIFYWDKNLADKIINLKGKNIKSVKE